MSSLLQARSQVNVNHNSIGDTNGNNFLLLTTQLQDIVPKLVKECEERDKNYQEREKVFREKNKKQNEETNRKAAEIIRKAEETAEALMDEASKKIQGMNEQIQHWKDEQAVVAKTQQFGSIIKLNVGGTKYETTQTTLTRFPDSMLGAMFSGRHALNLNEEGYHFIDRDGTHFRHILNFLRDPEHFTQSLSGDLLEELKKEVAYYGLTDDMFLFTPYQTEIIQDNLSNTMNYSNNYSGMLLKIETSQGDDGLWYLQVHNSSSNFNRISQKYGFSTGKNLASCCRKCNAIYMYSTAGHVTGVKSFFNNKRIIHNESQPGPNPNQPCPVQACRAASN